MSLITITTDELSRQHVRINTALVESIRFDRLGANSSSAYHIRMASGAVIKCNKANGERIVQAMETDQ